MRNQPDLVIPVGSLIIRPRLLMSDTCDFTFIGKGIGQEFMARGGVAFAGSGIQGNFMFLVSATGGLLLPATSVALLDISGIVLVSVAVLGFASEIGTERT